MSNCPSIVTSRGLYASDLGHCYYLIRFKNRIHNILFPVQLIAPTTWHFNAAESSQSYFEKKMVDKERKRREGELRNLFYRKSKSLRNRIEAIEKEVGSAAARITEIESKLEDPSSFGSREDFNRLLNEYEVLKQRRKALDDEWLELEIEMEAVKEGVWDGGVS